MNEIINTNTCEVWRRQTNNTVSKICRALNNYKLPRDEIYGELEIRAKCRLKDKLAKLKTRALKQGISKSKIKKFNYLDVIANDEKLKKIYINIVNDMAVKYRVTCR